MLFPSYFKVPLGVQLKNENIIEEMVDIRPVARAQSGGGAFFDKADCYACAEKKNAWLSRVRPRAHALAG